MANIPDQNQDPISLAWNKSRQLRDELASNAGKPDELRDKNLEINPLTDFPLTAAGSLATATGKGIKEIGLGDLVRTVRAVPDMVADAATESEKNISSNPFVATQMGMTQADVAKSIPKDNAIAELGQNIADSDAFKATANAASKGADLVEKGADYVDSNVVKPVVKPVGNALISAGEGIKSWRSDDAKEADNSTFLDTDANGNTSLGTAFSDPARLSIKFADLIGSIGGVALSSYAGGLAGKTELVKGMVKKSMLKRGASDAIANQVAEDTAKRWAQNSGIAAGINMSTGDTADQARQSYDQVSDQDKLNSPTFQDTVTAVHEEFPDLTSTERMKIVDERMRDKLASESLSNPLTYAAAATGTILGDVALAKMVLGHGAPMSGNVLTRAAKGFAKGSLNEGVSEGAEGGMQQYVTNTSSNEVSGTNIDPMQGVGRAVAENAIGGILAGGPTGAVGGAIHKAKSQPADNGSQDETVSPIQPENVPDISAARQEIDSAQKTPGSFSIGKSGDGYQAVFVDGAGQVNETPVFATAEEAQQAVTGNANAVRQDVSPQPQNDAQASQQPDDLANIPAYARNGKSLSPELEQAVTSDTSAVNQNSVSKPQNNSQSSKQPDNQQSNKELWEAGGGKSQPVKQDVVNDLSSPAYLRSGNISPELEGEIAQFQGDNLQKQAERQQSDGVMQPLENPITGNPNDPAYMRANAELNPDITDPTKSSGRGRIREVSGDVLPMDETTQVPAVVQQNDGVTVDGQANEVIPESRGLGYSGTINMPGQPGNGINDNYVPPVTQSRQTADKSLDTESTRDPRSPVAQSIAQAGTESYSIFGQLKSLRVTKKGKPFSSVKEAQLASRKTETPIELPTGGYGIVDKAELEQVQAKVEQDTTQTNQNDHQAASAEVEANESTSNNVVAQNQPDINVNESSNGQANANQPIADQAAVTQSPETVTAPVVAKESQPQPASNVEQISESYLKDVDLLKEHAGKWKYRYAVGANWQTANSKESAIERAQEAHQKAIANGDPLPTKAERYATSEAEQAAQMEQRYGKMSIPELEKEHARLGGVVSDLQQTGKNEFNGNGGRRTGAATANEGARDTGLEKMRLEGYIQTRKEREADNKTESYDERLNSRQERIKSATSNKEIDKVIAEQEADTERDWDTTRSLGIKAENRKRQIESHEDQQKTNEMLDAGKSVYATSFKSGQAANSYVEKKNKEDPDFEYTLHEPTMERQHTDFGEVTDSDWRVTKKRRNTSKPEKTIEDHFKDLAKYQSGEMDFDEFKQAASDFLDNEESVKAKLAALTKPEILKRMGPMFNYNYKGDKKDVIVDAAYQSLAGQLRFAAQGDKDVITETVSFEDIQGKRTRKTTASKAREEISALTSEKYGIYQEKAKAATKKAEERFQKVKQQISDPQTLDDFETFLNYRSIDKLTPEQKARYEDLKAERNLDKRDQAAAAAKETKVVPTATGDIVKTKHTKEGHDLFVVKLADRVDRDAYTTINAKAKELGGYYSKFRGNGAVPGFQFRTEEQAKEFQQWLSNAGNQTTSVEDVKATTDITAEPEVTSDESSKKKQADKLRDRAASVREKAQAELNADRKSNTVKRAREAAYAVARAEADLRFANIIDAIANGIEAGEIKYLRNMTAGTQLETLDTVLRRIVRSNKMSQAIRDDLIQKGYLRKGDDAELSWTDSAPIEVITQYAEMPGMDYWANILRDTAKNMQTTAGFKQAGVKIMNQVLMAINAENRMVTISDPELIDKLKQFSKQHEVRDYLKDTMADYDRLVRMGITSPIELRAALRELHKVKQSLKGTQPKRDPVKQKEDALKMRLLNNRNAFVDFFPTPDEHANDVIARAGIEPGMRVLEPSAGHGALAVAARDAGATVDAVELSNDLRDILTEKGFNLVGSDFMATEPAGEYDAVVMNPPFSNNMDIDHVKHAYAHLKPGGRLVAIVSSMAGERSNNKNKQFKEWLNGLGATEEMMPEGSFKNSMNPTSVRTKIIELQKPSDSKNVKNQPMGSRVTIHTPKGKPVEVQYQLVSAADLVASNEFDGRVNKSYPQELQPRDRTKASYQQQVNQIAANPEGSRLAGSPESDRGAPIVRDLVVESGNGRTIGIKQSYKQGTANEYRDYLIKHADEFGFTSDDVNMIDDPVLVRQRVSDLSPEERLDFVVDSNTDAKMANSATEDAKSDARYLDNGMMDLLNIPEGGDLLAASNERFLSAFATKLGSNSLNNYKDSSGRWNESFRKRVSNAIFAYGYDNDTLLKSATGDTSEAGKNLTSALMNNAASVAELRSMVPETAKAFVNYLAEGIDVMTSAKRNGQSIHEVVNQGDMLSGGVSHYGGAIAEMLSDASRSGKRLTETLNQITGMLNESAKSADQMDLLTGEPTQQVTAEEAINAAEKDFNERKQQEQRVRPSQDLFGANSARIGDNNGSGTSVSRPVSASETKSAGENSRLNLVNGLLGGETENVQFSKMPLNAAEKSGKGMTKPEAELAAKEWLKQFKTDVQVKVAKDQAEFDQLLTEAGQGGTLNADEIANAAYLPESKTLLLNASAIQNPARLRQLMRHEILGHHGLEYVIGKWAVNYILQILKNGYATSKAIRDAVDTVAANYADADVKTKIKEAFAHYAENRPVDQGPLGRLWDRVVSAVKSALVKAGFIKPNEAEQQLDSLLKTIAEHMRNGATNNDPKGGPGKKTYFSKAVTDDEIRMAKLGLGPKPIFTDKTKAQLDTLRQSDMNTVKSWITRMKRKSNTEILDALAPIKYAEDSAGKLDASDSGYVAARMAAGSSSVMQATMLYGIPEWKDGVIQRKAGTNEKDSMLGIFEGLGSDLHNWLAWMAGHRAEILMREGRENLLTEDDIKALKAKSIGKEAKFKAAKEKWNTLNKAMLDLAQEAGLFTADDRAAFESEWYVPFFRETDDGDVMGPYKKNGIANQSSGIKKLKGGTANVNDILENIFQTTSKLIDSSMKNMAAQKVVYNLAETDLISIIDKPNLIDIKAAAQNKQNMMMVKVDGESHVVQVNDPALFKAMTMIDSVIERDPFTKAAMNAKHLITAGVTSGPEFMLRNFLRDAVSTWAINEDGFKPMIDSIRGVKKAWKMDDSSINMMFSGASFMGGNLRGTDPEAMASVIRKTLRRKGMSPEKINEYENSLITTGRKAKDVLLHSWEQYERFGEAVENGSREAVYEAAIKAGKSHAQAAFEARDLMDFSMRGSSKIMRWLVDVLPFFNARMQGLGKLGRAMAANPKQIARRGGMIAAASLALLALNWDDDRYNDLPDWDKDNNWHFFIGDEHWRIPKPFEIGLLFGTLPERMVRTMGGKDTVGKFGEVVARNFMSTIEVNPFPQLVRPLAESYFNYDMFRGAPIENMSDLNVAPEARYDERTSLLMRELGQITGLSPKKLEHIVTGYTGTIGAYVVGICDAIVRASGDYGAAPAIRADQIPVLKSIYQGSAPAKSSQAMTDFYQLLDEANQVYSTIRQYQKEGRMGDAQEMLEENRNKLAGRKTMTNAQKQFRQIRNEMELIQRDRNLNSDEKRERIDRLLSKRNNFAAKLIKRFGTEL